MPRLSKRMKKIKEMISKTQSYNLDDAVKLLQNLPKTKFDEKIDVAFNLNLDVRQADQVLRQTLVLPHNITEKKVVAVITKGDKVEEALNAGADIVGGTEIVEKIAKETIEFDKLVATPDCMSMLVPVAKILGPKGLMPNAKLGTVTNNVKEIIHQIHKGLTEYRADKFGIVHFSFAKLSFPIEKIKENFDEIYQSVKDNKPQGAKGNYIKSVFLSSTMGAGLKLVL